MSDDAKHLRNLIQEIYEARKAQIRVSPAWIATEAMERLDGKRRSPSLVYLAAHLQLRQIARGILRAKFEGEVEETEQHELWPDLQTRYPAARQTGEEPEYVLLEHLEEKDVLFNYSRMHAEAKAKMRGADALLAWWKSRAA